MIDISVETDISRLKVKLFELRTKVVDKATSSALNKTIAAVRTLAARAIRTKLKAMKMARIKKRLYIMRAVPGNQVATLRCRSGTVPPGAFKLPGHGDALYVRVGPKHRTIVSKSGKSVGKKISSGYQLAPVQSVQVLREYGKDYVRRVMIQGARDKFAITFERELKYYGSK